MILSKREALLLAVLNGVWYTVALPSSVNPADYQANSLELEVLSEIDSCLVDDEWTCEYFDERDTWVEDFDSLIPSAGDADGIRGGAVPLRESHMVNILEQDSDGEYLVVFQDVRETQEYPFSFEPIIEFISLNTSIRTVVGECEDYPEANCISLEDFKVPPSLPDSTKAYYVYEDSDRRVGFKSDEQPSDYLYFHEFGHALGLSHKLESGGVMGYKTNGSSFNWAETSVIQDAYPRKIIEIPLD